MTKPKPKRQSRKTLEKRKRMLESKPDMLREDAAGTLAEDVQRASQAMNRAARQSESPVSRGGMSQPTPQARAEVLKQRGREWRDG